MHGQHCEERQQRHMWPTPSQRPVLGIVAESSGLECFSKGGRRINIGDCALFQAGNAPPFIGIIRKLISDKEDNLKLIVNWLYRPADVKLAKGVPPEAAPNEIFYSFHKDEISAASVLHPCKVSFLRKGAELPVGVSSFVCRRVYDTSNKCLWWLTDRDYADEHQEEVDQLLDRTKNEMQAAVQAGGPSSRALTGPTSSQQPKSSSEALQNAAFSGQGKGKKRERSDQNLDPRKRERAVKSDDSDPAQLKRERSMKPEEITSLTDKDGGLLNLPSVDQLVHLMRQERTDCAKKTGDVALQRTTLASIIAATDREDCLYRFLQLGGLPLLDDWLQEAHKGKVGDGGSPKEGDKGPEELLLTLLRAFDKLPVDLDALKTCSVGKSVNNLRSHKNLEIQKKSRKLVDIWKKRVEKMLGESKCSLSPSIPLSCKRPSTDVDQTHSSKGDEVIEASMKSTAGVKPMTNDSCPGDPMTKSGGVLAVGGKLPVLSSNVLSKENHAKVHGSGIADVLPVSFKEERSSSSSHSQSNGQSWYSGPVKGAGSIWNDEVKSSSTISAGAKAAGSTVRNHSSSRGHLTGCSTGGQKEVVGGVNENVAISGVVEKGSAESVQGEIFNNQRLLVRLPNPGRSSAGSGGSMVVAAAPFSQGSSPSSSQRHELVDGKSRTQNATQAAHSLEASTDTRSGNGGKPGTSGLVEKEAQALENLESSVFNSNKGSADGAEAGDGKKGVLSGIDVALSVDSHAAGSEVPEMNADEGGIDLLAGVAANESSEVEESVAVGIVERQNTNLNDRSREPEDQMSLIDTDSLHHIDRIESLPGLSGEGKKEREGNDLIDCKNPNARGLPSELGCIDEREEPKPSSGQEEGPSGILNLEQMPEGRSREGALEFTSISVICPLVNEKTVCQTRGAEGNQDECGAKVGKRETVTEEKAKSSRSGTGPYNGSSLTADYQAGTDGPINKIGSPEEGSEEGRQIGAGVGNSVRMSLVGAEQTPVGAVPGYYEEDALEVARQVAKEVEQEVERYGKPDAQEVTSGSASKGESKKETNTCDVKKNPWSSAIEPTVGKVKGEDAGSQGLHDAHAVACSDDSQETLTEKREDAEAERTLESGECEEVDQTPSTLGSADMVKTAVDSAEGSVVDACGEEKRLVSLDELSHSPKVSMSEQTVSPAACCLHTSEAAAGQGQTAASTASKDDVHGAIDTPIRPVFDLNEGFSADEAAQDDATIPVVSSVTPASSFPSMALGSAALPNCLAAPVAVVAATKGAFNPPTDLLRCRGEPGWKGSAARSAFRPAEPRHTPERQQSIADSSAGDTTWVIEKRARPLDIDLNVADERVLEDAGMGARPPLESSVLGSGFETSSLSPSCRAPVTSAKDCLNSGWLASSVHVTTRLELDLNRVDESEENATPLISDSREAEVIISSPRRSNNSFVATARAALDFDLNEDTTGDEPVMPHFSIGNPTLPALPGLGMNSKVANVAAWFPSANPLSTLAEAFSAARTEPPYPAVAAVTAKSVLNPGPVLSGDLYRAGALISSSPSVSYSTTMPATLPYVGFSFGSSFPFTSASSSAPYLESSVSAPFPPVTSQVVSAGAVVSPYVRPYLMGIPEVAGVENGAVWSRPHLDLNAGPDSADADVREDGICVRQGPAPGHLSFQQAGTSSKRKETEGGFDPFRPGFKQSTWQ